MQFPPGCGNQRLIIGFESRLVCRLWNWRIGPQSRTPHYENNEVTGGLYVLPGALEAVSEIIPNCQVSNASSDKKAVTIDNPFEISAQGNCVGGKKTNQTDQKRQLHDPQITFRF